MSFQTCLEGYTAGDLACYVTSQGVVDLLELWSLSKYQIVPSCAETSFLDSLWRRGVDFEVSVSIVMILVV